MLKAQGACSDTQKRCVASRRLLEIQHYTPLQLPLVHLLEYLRQVLQLVGAEVRFNEAPSRQIKRLDGVLAGSHGNAHNLQLLHDDNLGVGGRDGLQLALGLVGSAS